MANIFKSVALELPSTSASSNVYVCPANTTAVITLCQASNKGAGAYPITLQWIDSSAANTAYKLLNATLIPQYASLGCVDGKLVLNSGDYIQSWSNTSSVIELTVSVLEIS